jgi:DNA-binding GntR family transcriptional regulator
MTKLTSLKTDSRLLDRRAADQIRSHILSGVLRPGARLIETQLSEELEVSRSTVRAALALLVREGLVVQVAFTRWEVSGTSATDAWELYTLRGVLEGLAARLAAQNTRDEDGPVLEAMLAELKRAIAEERMGDAVDIDFKLHHQIVSMARHQRLADHYHLIIQQVRFHMVHAGLLPKDYDALVHEHDALIVAVLSQDPARAERLARAHNEAEIEYFSRHLERPEAFDAASQPAQAAS